MASFIGDYPCKIDPKGRIMLPSAFMKQRSGIQLDRFVVKKEIFAKCLTLYTMDEWERQCQVIREKTNPYNRDDNQFIREFYKGTAEVNLDGNNRILIPKRLLELANIKKDLILAGQDTKIEIWDAELYDSVASNEDDFIALAEKVMGGKNQ